MPAPEFDLRSGTARSIMPSMINAPDSKDATSPPYQQAWWATEDDVAWGLDGTDEIPRPPISPITPTASHERLVSTADMAVDPSRRPSHDSRFTIRPPPEPIDEDTNSDILALKSAASVLQIQKQKAKQDIQALKKIRDDAVKEPENFVAELRSGKLNHEPDHSNPLQATFEDHSESEDEEQTDQELATPHVENSKSGFGRIPSAQNVVRCPPVNWEKYHVVGQALDRMHEEQRRKPSPGQPWSEEREAMIAAPYSPFRDAPQRTSTQLPPPMETRNSHRRKSRG